MNIAVGSAINYLSVPLPIHLGLEIILLKWLTPIKRAVSELFMQREQA